MNDQSKPPARPAKPRAYSWDEAKEELARRMETFEQDAKASRPAEDVFAELQQRYAPK